MKNIIIAFFIVSMAITGMPSSAKALVLPPGDEYALNYGDFYSYSLPVLAYFYDRDVDPVGTGPSNPFYVPSSVGHIKDSVVIATGASGKPVNENFAGMDDAYPTPSGVKGSSEFDTAITDDPGFTPTMPANNPDTWDTTIAALTNFLGDGTPIFFFNNNQENSGGATAQNLWVYGLLTLWSSDQTADPIYLELVSHIGGGAGEFGGNPEDYTANQYSNPSFEPTPYDDYVFSGGQTCLDAADAPISCDSPDAVAGPFNHNLGADQAAYAVVAPELDSFLLDWTEDSAYDMMSIGIKMHSLNSGYEQAFISSTVAPTPNTVIPEPSTWILLGLGLLALPFIRKTRKG